MMVPSQVSSEPAADTPQSMSHPPSAARVTTAAVGTGSGHAGTGTDMLAVVPQDTIAFDGDAPAPRTSHGRSPAPTTTGSPARSPSSSAATGRSVPATVVGATGSGRSSATGPASPAMSPPSRPYRPEAEATVLSVTTSPDTCDRITSRGPSSHRHATMRSRSWASSHATLAATAPPSSTTPPQDAARLAASRQARRSDHSNAGPRVSPAAVTGTMVWRAVENPRASTSPNRSGAPARASPHAATTAGHHDFGSCSARSMAGKAVGTGARPRATSPSSAHSAALVVVVPRSMVKITELARERSPPPSWPPRRDPDPRRGPGPRPFRRRRRPSRRPPR